MSREVARGRARTALAGIRFPLLLRIALALVALAAVAGWAYRDASEPATEGAGKAGMGMSLTGVLVPPAVLGDR